MFRVLGGRSVFPNIASDGLRRPYPESVAPSAPRQAYGSFRPSSRAMPRDSFLFRAGRTGYTYPGVLEVRAGSVRLLRPSSTAKREQRAVSTLIAIAYVFIIGPILAVTGLPALGVVLGVGIGVAVYFLGLIAALILCDNRSLPLLAENPDYSMPLEILGNASFRTFA